MNQINILVAPDISPKHFAAWYILNTKLQKISNQHTHLTIAFSADEQFKEINEKQVDLIYANPFDTTYLVRELGYQAVARPVGKYDEMVIVSAAKGSIKHMDELKRGDTIVTSGNKDIKLIGLRLLEAVDLAEDDLNWIEARNYQTAARMVIDGEAQATFLLADRYHNFSELTQKKLHVLVESAMESSMHIFLAKEKNEEILTIMDALIEISNNKENQWIFAELGIPKGVKRLGQEGSELMIDIIDTLTD